MRDGHGEAQDGVLAVGRVHRDVAVEEGLPRDDVLLQHVEVEEAGFVVAGGGGGGVHGDDAARWGLRYDFGAWEDGLVRGDEMVLC